MPEHVEKKSGINGFLAFIIGGLVVAVAVMAWILSGGEVPTSEPDVSIEVPGVGTIEGDVKEN